MFYITFNLPGHTSGTTHQTTAATTVNPPHDTQNSLLPVGIDFAGHDAERLVLRRSGIPFRIFILNRAVKSIQEDPTEL